MQADPEYLLINEYCDNEMFDVKNSYMVVCIPKNASSWLEKNLGIVEHTESLHTKKVCVLRDPIERWASGVAEYLSSIPGRQRNERLILEYFKKAKEGVTNYGLKVKALGTNGTEGLDIHTKPQNRFVSKFISKSDESSTTWFYLDEQFTENFCTWASNNKLTIPYKHKKKINVTEKNTTKSDLIKHYLDLVSQDDFLQSKIKYFYQEDFDLIKRVEFYGK